MLAVKLVGIFFHRLKHNSILAASLAHLAFISKLLLEYVFLMLVLLCRLRQQQSHHPNARP